MLWESSDPHTALRERFGFDGFDDAVGWLATTLAHAWGVEVQACDRILISDQNAIAWVRTDRGAMVAKWSRHQERFARFTAIADLLAALHRDGVPVAAPLAASDGRHRVIVDSGSPPLSVMVQPLVEGDFLDSTEAAVRRAGACLASLHRALAGHCDDRLTEAGPGVPVDLRGRVEAWLDHQDAGRAPAASARLREELASLSQIDGEPQLIHNDYRSANILTAGSEILAVIDFDEVVVDHCVSDLGKASVLLCTRFRDWQPAPARLREALLAGYESVRPLTGLEHRWLGALTLWTGIAMIPAGDDPAGWADAL